MKWENNMERKSLHNTINIEAEGGELIIKNDKGDIAIIPQHKRNDVISMIQEEKYEDINDIVNSLPKTEDYSLNNKVSIEDEKKQGFFNKLISKKNK